jgi:hypothetical protein
MFTSTPRSRNHCKAGGVLEVQLVVDHAAKAGLVEQIEERDVRLLAR